MPRQIEQIIPQKLKRQQFKSLKEAIQVMPHQNAANYASRILKTVV